MGKIFHNEAVEAMDTGELIEINIDGRCDHDQYKAFRANLDSLGWNDFLSSYKDGKTQEWEAKEFCLSGQLTLSKFDELMQLYHANKSCFQEITWADFHFQNWMWFLNDLMPVRFEGPFLIELIDQLDDLGLLVTELSQDHGEAVLLNGYLPKKKYAALLLLFVRSIPDGSKVKQARVENFDFSKLLPEPDIYDPLVKLLEKRVA